MSYLFLLFMNQAFAAKPKFHCYTYPNSAVAAYQTPVKCGNGKQMEIVCTYSAGCKPTKENGEPPAKTEMELATMFTSNELKGSFLICKGKGTVENGVITKAECPTATQCRGDGMFGGVVASVNVFTDRVTAPEKGGPRATR